jgi:competence ComEA-like helix-hairpin-helix protein
MSRRVVALLGAAAALLAVAPPASAQTDQGLFSVSPARQVVVGNPPKRLPTYTVTNSTQTDLAVTVFPVLIDQDISGQFIFSEARGDLRAALNVLTPDRARFDLPSGSHREVVARWNQLPQGERTANIGLVFQSAAKPKDGQAVETVQRLLTISFMRRPGRYTSTGEFTGLRAEQGQERTLDLIARIRNTGELPQSPTKGVVRVRNAAGDVVFRSALAGDVILPGKQRDFPVTVKELLPKGEYTMSAVADFGQTRRMRVTGRFTLVGPNQLPTPHVVIQGFHGEGELGGDSAALGTVRNDGTAPADTSVRVELYRLLANGQRPVKPISSEKLAFKAIPVGAGRPLRVDYPKLAAGSYRVIAVYRDTPETLQRVEDDFSPAKAKDESGGGGPPVVAILIVLLLVLALAAALLRERLRRRARTGEEPEAPPAAIVSPAPTPTPPAAARIDINVAGVEELQRLPGVGPKAAERIVEAREEYGRFEKPGDLLRVEGFDAERVAALEDRVSF